MKISVGVDIAAPPDAVWAVLEPIEHHVEWMSEAESIMDGSAALSLVARRAARRRDRRSNPARRMAS